jgi:hypothetical protein
MSVTRTYASMARHPARVLALLALAALVLGTLFTGRARANLDPGTFELDGNTLVDAAPAHDWSQVFDSGTYGASGADKDLFIPDYFPGADDQPATGGTKDTNDLDKWDCKLGVLSPPKNDMANAFVASYTVGGHQLLYFGLDRINSDNGNADVGFWFLKHDYDCDPSAGTADFTGGKHTKGDTLVTSEFTGGGSVSTINVFVWCSDPAAPDLKCGDSTTVVPPLPGKGDGPIQLVFTGADCRNPDGTPSAFATGLACATVNRTINTESPPWPYTGAGTPSDTYERGAFFEGGIDATGLGLDLVCTGTFLADTRSSQSPTAQLHDFALGQVDTCSVTLSTTSSTTSTTVVPGTAVSDTATLVHTPSIAPNATGTVKFFLCQPSEVTAGGCEGTAGTQIGTPAVGETVSGEQATSDTTTNTTAIGKYCWRAEYSGDSTYGATSHTNSTTECFTTVKQPSTTVTSASPSGDSVVPGTSVSDTATVSGGAGQPTPTGTVKFFLCQPSEVTAGGCEGTAGTQIGTPAEGETLNGSGVASSESTTNTTAIGTYCWRAEYSGDGFYLPSKHTNALTAEAGGVTPECFTTVKQPSTTVTSASPSGSVLAGLSVSDTATVSGGAGQPTPTGTVKFFLCQPSEVTAGGCEGTAGTQIGTPAEGETLNASGVASSESTTNTTTVGTYCWRAEYSGDDFYLPSSHTNALTAAAGGETPECFTTFNPSTLISFSDQIVGLPSDATGTVTYEVFTDSACTEAAPDGDITPSPNAVLAGGVAPSSLSYTPAAPGGTFYIKATFTGDGAFSGVIFTSCTEHVVVSD